MSAVDVQLRAEWIIGTGYRYHVFLDGEAIVSRSRDPEHDAARALHARGLRGSFRTIDFVKGKHRMTLDIKKAAGLRVVESGDGPPRTKRYCPLTDDVRALLDTDTSDQERVLRGARFPDTGDGKERGGGDTCPALAPLLIEDDQILLPEEV